MFAALSRRPHSRSPHSLRTFVLRVEGMEERLVPAFLATTDYGGRVGDAVVVADFNGDGKADLASIATAKNNSIAGTVVVQLGNGSGGFGSSKTTTLATCPQDMAAADLNGDGKIDLVTTQGGSVTVLLGKGTGLFQAPKNFALTNATGYSLAVADVDGDGRRDVAVTGLRITSMFDPMNGVVDVFKGDGKGSLARTQSYDLPSAPGYDWMGTWQSANRTLTAVGDFNGDHRPDLVVAVPFNAVGDSMFILTNVGGSPAAPTTISLYAGWTLAVGDMNGDGRQDLVTQAGVSLGNGDGTFQTAVHSGLTDLTQYGDAIVLADLNGDGTLDVVNNNRYLLGNGDGTVRASVEYAPWSYSGAFGGVAVGDFNGDGFLDLVSVVGDGRAYQMKVALNAGNW